MMEDKRKGFWSREPARVLDELAAAKARCPTNGQFGLRQDVQLRELKKPRGFEHLTEAQQKAELRNMERAAHRQGLLGEKVGEAIKGALGCRRMQDTFKEDILREAAGIF